MLRVLLTLWSLKLKMWTFFVFSFLYCSVNADYPPACDSEIFCRGTVLHAVQNAKLFDDDKHFVDMKLKEPPGLVLSAFHNLSLEFPDASVPPARLHEFLTRFFEEPGSEFEAWIPPDWNPKPKFLERISDTELRSWAEKIHQLWKSLGRKISAGVRDHPELYSMIYTPHPVVVPGGRFRELYYWDSYWVINGLLLSEMTETARGMIQNFLFLVDRYGFVPNGGRVYYERRSQPPFLTLMVESFYQATQDGDFLRAAVPVLEQEYQFWMVNRSVAVPVDGVEHVLNRYEVQAGWPRPEAYTDDLELAAGLNEARQQQLWMDLKAGAESGWDFSSRWYINGAGSNAGGLGDTRTSQILPVDLNALLCLTEKTLAAFHRTLGDEASAARYDRAAVRRVEAVEAVLWDPPRGAWLDYNLLTRSRHPEFYPSNVAPLWARCYVRPERAEQAVQYLKASGAFGFPNGVPTSLRESGQQWDFPNAWPPLQHMLIQGLSRLPSEESRSLALDLAQRWIRTNWLAYVKYEAMFEKYDVNGDGKPGGGGEYEVQLGFGWTNGVALQLLDVHGAALTSGCTPESPGFLLVLAVATVMTLH